MNLSFCAFTDTKRSQMPVFLSVSVNDLEKAMVRFYKVSEVPGLLIFHFCPRITPVKAAFPLFVLC